METELKFEKALERLEKIVEDLESGNMPLEDALRKYEEGVKLCRVCTEKLSQTETKIEALTRTLNGASEFGASENKDAPRPSSKKTKKREKEGTSEEPFLI